MMGYHSAHPNLMQTLAADVDIASEEIKLIKQAATEQKQHLLEVQGVAELPSLLYLLTSYH
jgi:hypothetical protein